MDQDLDTAIDERSDATVTPFPGGPAANLNGTAKARLRYGLQPGATQLLAELAATLDATLDRCAPHAMPAATKAAMRGYLCQTELLRPEHKTGSADNYRRHLLYADPQRQFSILAIVWQPGQRTAVHGHTAWGAVGVFSGNPYCEIFDTSVNASPRMRVEPTVKLLLKPQDMATVQPGIDDVHRIGNDGPAAAITIHVYGRDLLAQPASINITFN